MTNIIKVIHCAFEDQALHVATVTSNRCSINEDLEYAFRWTQNIEDSWSMKGEIDGNSDVVVEAPLHRYNGQTVGLRSTSVGDQMIVGSDVWRVDGIGFTKLDCQCDPTCDSGCEFCCDDQLT